jgi:hypothetical protein
MLTLILKDKGSNKHCKITDEDFNHAQRELDEIKGDNKEVNDLYDDLIGLIAQYSENFSWFDYNALKNADKKNIGKFMWLLARPYAIQLEKEGLYQKYGFESDLHPTQKEEKKFINFFKRRDAIGTRFIYAWGGDWTQIFSKGFQLWRLILGPFGYITGKIPFVALGWFILWVGAAFTDWIFLGIPYLIMKSVSGLPKDYYYSDLILSPYLLGNTTKAKDTIRELVKNDKANADAYDAALWGLYMREKLVEILRKERGE